jgi:hypothetical protein
MLIELVQLMGGGLLALERLMQKVRWGNNPLEAKEGGLKIEHEYQSIMIVDF